MCLPRECHSNASSATEKAGETTATHKQGATPAVAVRAAATHPKGVEGVVGAGDQAATTVPKLDKSTAGAEVVVVQ